MYVSSCQEYGSTATRVMLMMFSINLCYTKCISKKGPQSSKSKNTWYKFTPHCRPCVSSKNYAFLNKTPYIALWPTYARCCCCMYSVLYVPLRDLSTSHLSIPPPSPATGLVIVHTYLVQAYQEYYMSLLRKVAKAVKDINLGTRSSSRPALP